MPKKTQPTDRSYTLVNTLKPGQTPAAGKADMMVGGLATNAITALAFSQMLGELDLPECVTALATVTQRVNGGDLSNAEALLTAQGVVLNTIFTELSRRSLLNMGEYLDAADRYMRLALKAQGQCRATIETLALMKNPPTVFARQANIAHGPQQVNNGTPVPPQGPSRAGNQESEPNKLLEANGDANGDGLVRRTSSTTGRRDPEMASVGPLDRTAKHRRQG